MNIKKASLLMIFLVLTIAASISVSAEASWKDPSWSFRKQISLNHSKVIDTQTNFAVLISINDANLIGKVQDDAGDIIFTSEDGITQLSHEIESYDSATGRLSAWVKVPTLSSIQDTIIYVYYGNPSIANQGTPEAVWDSNYLAVQHMEEKSGLTIDSTINNNDGTPLNGVVQGATGKINGANQYDGIDDRTIMPQVFNSENQFTFEAWINTNSKQGYIISQRDSSSRGAFLQFNPNSFQMYVDGKYVSKASTANAWHYVVGTYDGTTARLYVDNAAPITTTATITWPAQQTFIGDRSTLGRAFKGTIDEIKISNTARSQAYIRTSYNNQNSPATFIMLGQEESSPIAPSQVIISNPNPDNTDTEYNPDLSVFIQDPEDKDLTIIFETNMTGTWETIGTQNGKTNTYVQETYNFNDNNKRYYWRVKVFDGTAWKISDNFNFVAKLITSNDWSFRKSITIDNTKVVGELNNFPVLIDTTINPLHAQSNAYDIYFTTSDGTKLAHEIESYDSLTGRVVAWANLPSITSTTPVLIYMYYGNPNAENQQNIEAVWDSNYLAVQHMEEKSGIVEDSTVNNNDGTPLNGVVQGATGKIDGANQFDGTDDRIVLPQVFNSENQFTFEAWINTNSKQGYIISQRDLSSRGAFLQFNPNSFQMYADNKYVSKASTANAWHYVVGTYDGTNIRLYVDNAAPITTTATITWPAQQTFIGDRSTLGRAFKGTIDEIKISNTARSESYIRTSYNNQNNPTTFIITGEEELLSSQPLVSNENPLNGRTDILFSLTELSFNLYHPQGKLMNYTVITSPNIGTGNAIGVSDGTYTVPVSGVMPNINYTWNVEVTDGTEQTYKTFTFTTITPPSQVIITEGYPNNLNTTYNPRLSVKVDDLADNNLTVVFETNTTGTWLPIGTQQGKDRVYYQKTTGMDLKGQKYYWRVSVFDGMTWKTSEEYNFIAKAAFIKKWEYNHNAKTNNGPLAVDVNNDGIYEILTSGFGKVSCLNGLTGDLMWEYKHAGFTIHTPLEAADLNNDGIPEVVIPADIRTIVLHANNGSLYWSVMVEGSNKYPLILDTDGNKYPYVYVARGDHFYGEGMLRKLRGTDGTIVAETPVWYPCYSGLSAADANNDGKFEVYMCDRKTQYEGPEGLGRGMQAYDADDLSLLWYDGNITCSSHLIALIDVNKDNILDSIALPQSGTTAGIFVIDGATQSKMVGKWSLNLNKTNNVSIGSHSPPSVYDIDLDGNIELITSREGPAKVWDLNSWSMDVNFSDYNFSEPPRFADVIGDEKLEIVGVTGDIRIYNGQYNLIESITGVNPIAATMVQDIDMDGQNELIVTSYAGLVTVYETSAYTPAQRVRTNVQLYGEKRLGAGVYEPLPGAPQPFIKEAYPADTAVNVELNPILSARIVDYHYDLMDITISTNASGAWETVASWNNASNGWYNYTPADMNQGDTTYYWRVTAIDTTNRSLMADQTFSFTTKPQVSQMPGWNFMKRITINREKVNASLSNFPVLIDLTDSDLANNAQPDGDDIVFTGIGGKLSHEIESYNSATGKLTAWVKVPSLSSSVDTVIYMYFGNPVANNQQNPEGVWDSNYLSVHHLEETAGTTVDDSTDKNNNGVTENVNLNFQGKIDGADEFNGVNSITSLPQIFTNQNQFTIEGWVRVMDGNKQQALISQRDWSQRGVLLQYDPAGTLVLYVNDKTTTKPLGGTTMWHYVVATYDGTTARLYRDETAPVSVGASLTWPTMQVYLADRNTRNRPFNGMLDEVRISNIARSPAYIATSFNNQNDPSAFITVGAIETSEGTKPAILNEYPSHLSENVPYNINELSFDLFDNQNDLLDYTITTTPNIGFDVKNDVTSGKYTLNITSLEPNTEYKWDVSVTDGSETSQKLFKFKTGKAYTIKLSTSGSGSISSSCASVCPAGTEVELIAIPAEGWTFVGWAGGRVGREISGTETTKNIILKDNLEVFASFRQIGSELIADSNFDASISNEDLRANASYQDWWESRAYDPLSTGGDATLLTLDTINVGGNNGKKAKLSESNVSNAYMTQEFVTTQTNRFTIKWDIYVDSIFNYSDVDRTGTTIIGRDLGARNGPNSGNNDKFIMLAFHHTDGSNVSGDSMSLIAMDKDSSTSNSTTWKVIAPNLQIGQWHNIRLDINVPTARYDVYVDDVRRAQNVEVYNPLLSKITHISFATWNDARGTFYIDNVK